ERCSASHRIRPLWRHPGRHRSESQADPARGRRRRRPARPEPRRGDAAQAEQEEVNLSYTRRLLQGRLDIVRRELQRRAEHDGRSLVDLLPEILSEKGRGPAHGLGRHQTVQPAVPEEYESWVNSLTPGMDLSGITELTDVKLERAAR